MAANSGTNMLKATARAVLPKAMLLRLLARRALGRHDNPELELLPHFEQGGLFADIGANIGDYTRVGCLTFSRLVAVEPIPELAAILRRDMPASVTVLGMALSDTPGTGTLFIPIEAGEPATALASLSATANGRPRLREVTVEIGTIDGLGLTGIDLIKIDVEGTEEAVLRGGLTTLARERPGLIIEIEDRHHPARTAIVFEMLHDLGYDSYFYQNDRLNRVRGSAARPEAYNRDDDDGYIVNFVFIHRSRRYPALDRLIAAA
jgi:FkbM family methyltransferase